MTTMNTLLIGSHGAYGDEVTFARHESARRLAGALRTRTLDWAARLVYRVAYPGHETYVTDPVDVYRITREHRDASVEIVPVHRR